MGLVGVGAELCRTMAFWDQACFKGMDHPKMEISLNFPHVMFDVNL